MKLDTDRRTFPIKGIVLNKKDFTYKTRVRLNMLGENINIYKSKNPAVGYLYVNFHDKYDNTFSNRALIITLGISFCDPDDWKNFNSSTGKNLAKEYAYSMKSHRYVSFVFDSFETSSGEKKLRPYLDNKETFYHPDTCGMRRFFDVDSQIQEDIAKIFNTVELMTNYNMRVSYLHDQFICGKDYVYCLDESIFHQIQEYLTMSLRSYLERRFKISNCFHVVATLSKSKTEPWKLGENKNE